MEGLPLFTLSSLFVISQLFSLGSTLMEDVVVTKDSAESVRLKCHNTSATGPSGVQWNLSSEDLHIIERTSSGQILTGDNYTRSVALQDNGDLLLYMPSVSDSGIYTCVRFEANRTENYTSNVHLIVHPTASSADQLRSTIIVILLSIDVILIDANVILLLSHCQTYRKHKDIWSLRLFFLSYYIIYVTTGLLFLLLYVIGSKSEFLFNVGSTCSATSLPPVLILWIDFFVIVKRANRRRSQLKESALMEDMVPVIRTARYLTNGDRAGSAHRDNARLRKRYQIEDRPTKRSTCCSGQAEDDSGLETVELTGHRTHEIDRSPSQPTR